MLDSLAVLELPDLMSHFGLRSCQGSSDGVGYNIISQSYSDLFNLLILYCVRIEFAGCVKKITRKDINF